MEAVTGPVRYFFLRKARGAEDVADWPPLIKPLEVPANKVCGAVRLYADRVGWRAECGEDAVQPSDASEPALVLTRNTAFALLQDGKRTKADAALMGVRVVNLNEKGVEYVTHLIVRALAGLPGAPRRPLVVPVDRMVMGEYVEHGSRAVAGLDLRIPPAEFVTMTPYLPDREIERVARRNLDTTVLSTARFYSYGHVAKHGITLEVEAGRVSLYGRVDLTDVGEQVRAAMLETPGVVEVADHMLYVEALKEQAEQALAAKGLGDIQVLSEHALIILLGEVPDAASRYKAEDIVKRIPGVRGVVNNTVVRAGVS